MPPKISSTSKKTRLRSPALSDAGAWIDAVVVQLEDAAVTIPAVAGAVRTPGLAFQATISAATCRHLVSARASVSPAGYPRVVSAPSSVAQPHGINT